MTKLIQVGGLVAALAMGAMVHGAETPKATSGTNSVAKAEQTAKKPLTKAEQRAARRAHEKLLDKYLGPTLDKKFKVVYGVYLSWLVHTM